MTNPTSNFGWQMPEPTDLVTDLPADFEVFGQAVDTDFVDLLGGTTGQVLSKTSNTDLDFTWIANDQGDITGVTAGTGISGGGTSGTVTVTNSMATAIDAKGDLVVGTGADAFSRLAVGTNTYLLTADSAEATGLKWAAPAGGGSNFTLLNSGGTALSGSSTTVSGISGADKLFVRISTLSSSNAYADMTIRFNADTGSNYTSTGYRNLPGTIYDAQSICATTDTTATSYTIGALGSNTASRANIVLMLQGGNSAGTKIIQSTTGVSQQGGIEAMPFIGGGLYAGSSTISSITVEISTGTFDQGTIFVYTSA